MPLDKLQLLLNKGIPRDTWSKELVFYYQLPIMGIIRLLKEIIEGHSVWMK